MESLARERVGRLPIKRNLHLIGEESSKSKTDEVKSPPPHTGQTTKNARSVFDRLGTQRSLTPRGERILPIQKDLLKGDELAEKMCNRPGS